MNTPTCNAIDSAERQRPPGQWQFVANSEAIHDRNGGIIRSAAGQISRRVIGHLSFPASMAIACVLCTVAWSQESLPAFPSAEGFGAGAVGGRGGRVIQVTNLNDRGPGSLRAAIEAKGPRTVVFRVGGTVENETGYLVTEPYLTIAGQTAPGGGITLKWRNNETWHDETHFDIATHNVVLRHIRIRSGGIHGTGGESTRFWSLLVSDGAHDVIVDHCSISWSTDQNVNIWGLKKGVRRVTIQWCISSEGLSPHSAATLMQVANLSYHHNLMAHNRFRSPRVSGSPEKGSVTDIVNNVAYDYPSNCASFSAKSDRPLFEIHDVNFVGNFHIRGPSPDVPSNERRMFGYLPEVSSGIPIYMQGNIGPQRSTDELPQTLMLPESQRRFAVAKRFPAPSVRTTSAKVAYDEVLARAGCRVPMQDEVDERIIREVRTGTGRIPENAKEVGGWPRLPGGTPYADADEDGIADSWESARGLDPSDPTDGAKALPNGYTHLENYLAVLAGDKLPGNPYGNTASVSADPGRK